jgi:hypothetical protein
VIVESKGVEGKKDLAVAALYLIDLAGSESANVHRTGNTTVRNRELRCINRVSTI